jgi:hypothetical protein
MMTFYRAIELPSNEPVQYVGCYVLRWGKIDQPTIGFIEAPDLAAEVERLRAALRPFAALYHKRLADLDDDAPLYQHCDAVIRIGDVRQARAALDAAEEDVA